MFPNESALGKTLYESRGAPLTIVGVVDHMLGSWPLPGQGTSNDIMFLPRIATGPNVPYLVRTKPGMRDSIMRQVEKEMGPRNRARAIDFVRPLDLYVKRTYMLDRNMSIYLVDRHVDAAHHHLARHLRTRDVQREHAHQAGRHAPRGGRSPSRRGAAFPRGELDDHDRGRGAGKRACARRGSLAVHRVPIAACRPLLHRRVACWCCG